MPKLNLRWLAVIVFVPILLGVFFYFLHSFQMGRNSHVFLREARRAQAENRPQDAVNYLRRYVKLAPKDVEGLILYGFQLADLKQAEPAFNVLDRAIQKQPDRMDVRRRLVTLCMSIRRFRDAIDHLENHLLKESPTDGELLEQLAACQLGLNEYDQAAVTLQRAMDDAPNRLEPYVMMAFVQGAKLNNVPKALETLDQMVTRNPKNPKSYFNRGEWLLRQLSDSKSTLRRGSDFDAEKQLHQIISDVNQALELDPDDQDSLILAAQVAQATNRRDEARELFLRGIEKYPLNPQFYKLLAVMEMDSGNPKAALEVIEKGLTAVPKNLDLQWNQARLLIEMRNFDSAAELLAQLRQEKFTDELVEYLEARSLFLQGDWSKAIEKFESLRPRLQPWPLYLRQVDFWLGLAYRETNSPDQQLASFRRAVASDPNWYAARLALAESLAASELFPEAITELQSICASPQAPLTAQVALAKLLLRQNLTTPANRRDWAEFEGILKKLEAAGTQETSLAVLRMQKQLVTQDYTGAVQTIADAREQFKDQMELWTAAFDLALAGRDYQRVDEVVQGAEKQFGDTVAIRLMKGRALIAQRGTPQETIAEMRTLSAPPSEYSEADRLQLAEGFASLFLLVNAFDDAERMALQVAIAQPKNLGIRLLLMDIARRAKRPELMDGVLKEIHRVAGEGAIWHYGQAERLVLKAQDANDAEAWSGALAHLEKARATRPTWERIPLLTAEIHERRGESRQAIAKYLEAIRMGEKSPIVSGRVLSLLLAANRFEDAEKLIQQLKDRQAIFTVEMVKYEIALELQFGRKDQARKLIDQLVGSKSPISDSAWLGQAYMSVDNYDASAEQYRAAIAADRKQPQPWVGLVRALVLGKHPEQAEEAVTEAKAAIPPDQADLPIGQCYELLGKMDLAREHYREALERSPENPELSRKWVEFLLKSGAVADAETELRKMLENSSGTSENDQAVRLWLRRNLAIALLSSGRKESVAEAIGIVDQNLNEVTPSASEDMRLKANILAKSNSQSDRRQAIDILEKLVARERTGEFQADDHWLLASLYQLEGDLKKWRFELRRSMTDRKEDPRFLAAFVKLSLLEKETSQAEIYLDLLQKLAPADLLTLDLKAQVLFARNQFQELSNLFKKTGNQKPEPQESSDAVPLRRYWAAKQFENYAAKLIQEKQVELSKRFMSEASLFYEQLIAEKPELILVYAEFLAGTEQVGRSLSLLAENLEKASVVQVVGITRKAMRNPSTTSDQMGTLQDLVQEKSKAVPDSLALSLALADFMSWRGEYDYAMQIYRKMLADDQQNTIALNNLAFLIALTGGNHREALNLVDKAIEIGGPVDAFLDTRGLVYLAAGHSDKAALEFEKALSENETAEEHYHAAVAYSRINKMKEAKEALQKATELGLVEQDLHPIERRNLSKLKELLNGETP